MGAPGRPGDRRAGTTVALPPSFCPHPQLHRTSPASCTSPTDLKSPAKGGTTAFPDAAATKEAMGGEHRSGNSPDDWYCREPRALAAAPPAGTGVLFW